MTPRPASRALLAHGDPAALVRRLTERLRATGVAVTGEAGARLVRHPSGTARIEARDGGLLIEAEAEDLASLALLKGSLAFQLRDLAAEGPGLAWTGDGCDGRLPQFRPMRCVGTAIVSPRMRRVTLQGEDMARFASGGLHVRLLIPPKGRAPVWPHAAPSALPVWPSGEDRLTLRTYTIRRIDAAAGLVDIDIALHDAPGAPSAGSRFALSAEPGSAVGLMGPGGGTVLPAAWSLLVGDETALPAIARILETLPATARGVALIEVADAGEVQRLVAPPDLEVRWFLRNGRGAGSGGLLEAALAGIDWPDHDDVFAWAGTEFAAFKALRRHFRKDRGLARDRHLACAHWRRGRCEGEGGA